MLNLFAPRRPKVVAFDIIGTTFSIEPMRAQLTGLGLPPAALEVWFAESLRDAFALAATDAFEPFRKVQEGALRQVLGRLQRAAEDDQIETALDAMKELPPHPDVCEAFSTLAEAGIRVVALSNGASSTTRRLLERAGLDHFVETVVSVDDVKLSKPRREVYLHAVEEAAVEPGELALVATHPWDIHGAKSAGLLGAYVARGKPYPSVMKAPDLERETLLGVASALVDLKA